MAKDLIDDIKRSRRSLQDVLPAARPKRAIASSEDYQPPRRDERPRRPRRRWPVILLVFLIIIIPTVYLASIMFGRATVTVTARQLPLTVTGTYRAVSLPASAASSSVLGFQTMTIRRSDSVTIPAGQAVPVAEKSNGTIVIANRYSQKPQRLVANTRFETAAGKVYRIQESVLVPGYSLAQGKMTPGELAVTVTADQPGADYNGAPTTFTISGFKNDARFQTITARGKTPFVGGFVGERKVVNPVAQAAAVTELVRQLKDRLLAEASSQIPNEYVWYPSTAFWRLGEVRFADSGASTTDASLKQTVKLTQQVELVAPIFSRLELSQTLARQLVPSYDEAPVLLEKIESLNLQPLGAFSDPGRLSDFTFTLAGQGVLVWQFNVSALARDLAGRGSSDYQAVFVKYPSIANSRATFSPPWLIRFPADSKKITILTEKNPSAKLSSTTNQRDITNGN